MSLLSPWKGPPSGEGSSPVIPRFLSRKDENSLCLLKTLLLTISEKLEIKKKNDSNDHNNLMRLIPSYKSHLASLCAQLYYGHHWISSTGPWYLQLAPDADSFSFSFSFVLLETWAGACRDGSPGHVWPMGDQGSSGRRLEWMGHLSVHVPFCGVATRLSVSCRRKIPVLSSSPLHTAFPSGLSDVPSPWPLHVF